MRRPLAVLLAAATALAVASLTTGAAQAEPLSEVTCSDEYMPTALGQLYMQVCRPADRPSSTVEVLIHGGAYNATYWDFDYQPEKYSYVHYAASRGHTTVAIDKIGSGKSAHPASALVTQTALANIVHALVGKLRSGQVAGGPFEKVVTVGHSMGSALAAIEASTYRDVDAVVLTGFSHRISLATTAKTLLQVLHPATLDPKFGLSRDPGYLTTRPGQRATVFYTPDDDPAAIQWDDQNKDIISLTELGDGVPGGFMLPTTTGMTAPVLVMNGQYDALMCDPGPLGRGDCTSSEALRAQEAPQFPNSPQVDAHVVAGAAHCLTGSHKSIESFETTFSWIEARTGQA